MFRALSALLFISLFSWSSPAQACQMFADESWFKDANLTGPCDLGEEPVELALVDYTDIEQMISYRINWHQDLSDTDCPRFIRLTIKHSGGSQSHRTCNQPFPLDDLTAEQLLQRLSGIEPLFHRGNLNGDEILNAIASEI